MTSSDSLYNFPPFRCLIGGHCSRSPKWRFGQHGLRGSPKSRSSLSDHVAANTPEASSHVAFLKTRLSCDDADFVHQMGTRPPQLLFTRLLMRSLVLQPGLSRSILADYIVEPLSLLPLPSIYRLLATWRQSFTTFGTLSRFAFLTHPNRKGTVYLGTHLTKRIFMVCCRLPVSNRHR